MKALTHAGSRDAFRPADVTQLVVIVIILGLAF